MTSSFRTKSSNTKLVKSEYVGISRLLALTERWGTAHWYNGPLLAVMKSKTLNRVRWTWTAALLWFDEPFESRRRTSYPRPYLVRRQCWIIKHLFLFLSLFIGLVLYIAQFGHVACHNSFSETTLKGTLEGSCRRGREKKSWMDNTKEWTSLPMPELLTKASLQKRLEEDLCWIVPHVPSTTQSVKGLNWTELILRVIPIFTPHWRAE